ncbi:histone acetyltransferase [Linnemannia schmuckeri]|uniref:histone acetyltransferase n=1 Tax=Linnemannia schmuckeri TaxID=64567 RepID=A0A9P5S779_9FUNG|nr:histone acetyltransferase [Linnemannia schmuckeri]
MDQPQDPDKAQQQLLQQQQQQQQQQQPSPPDENKDSGDAIDIGKESNGATPPAPTSNGLNYPPADKPIDSLSMSERMMKIGRSCPCDFTTTEQPLGATPVDSNESSGNGSNIQGGCDCQGWRPKPPGTMGRVDICTCGHKLSHHGGPWTGEEFDRRLRAAFRRDELLQDKGKLLDFEYDDEDIASLRKQIVPRDIPAEDSKPEPVNGHHMANGISHDNEESNGITPAEEASELAIAVDMPLENGDLGSANKHEHTDIDGDIDLDVQRDPKRIKIEAEDEQETTNTTANGDGHIADQEAEPVSDTEQTQESSVPQPQEEEDEVPIKKEKPAVIEERQGLIEFRVFTNDGSRDSMILLTGMKNLFQKQLPKMPREYIARLVYDRNHYSMAIVKAPLIVLGGITYRPFNHRKFAEIVFCAITSTEQVKGYGSHLMNHLKDYISENTDVQHFLTYADNYAIGYFKKQGFTKDITLDRSIWMGYIKDYEGGTIMQCTMVPRVKYLEVNSLLQTQRKAVITKIKEVSKSHIIYPGLQDFKNGAKEVDPMTVPGIKESGWDPLMDITPRVPVHGPHYNAMKHIVAELIKDASSWPFLHPVDVEAVTDYYSYIKDPMDLSTLESNVDADVYQSLDDFARDCRKIFDNCRLYNGESTPYVKCANKLEKVFKDKLKEWKEV